MSVVSPEDMEDTWKSVAGSSSDEILALQQRCGRLQQELTGFVLRFTSEVSSDALGIALWVQLVVMQAFQRHSSKLKRVKSAKIERAWQRNTTLFAQCIPSAMSARSSHCMQPLPQAVINFACANLPRVWRAADAACYTALRGRGTARP